MNWGRERPEKGGWVCPAALDVAMKSVTSTDAEAHNYFFFFAFFFAFLAFFAMM
jgi:hypothetical protein